LVRNISGADIEDVVGPVGEETIPFSAERVVAMTVAPASRATCMVAVPIPPEAPVTRTLSFGRTFSRPLTMWWAVEQAHIAAAISS